MKSDEVLFTGLFTHFVWEIATRIWFRELELAESTLKCQIREFKAKLS